MESSDVDLAATEVNRGPYCLTFDSGWLSAHCHPLSSPPRRASVKAGRLGRCVGARRAGTIASRRREPPEDTLLVL
jgi:hypothetical protein